MSMLADHKTRPSWVLNPRASDWSKDQNKLGQKMLEKMGWSVGKGLGAKEQGPVEALRVAHKVNVRGLGASRKKEQEYWLQQQESFQSLLQTLNSGDDQNVEVKSLEARSKTSRTRIHYHKFTRGKDISRYSEKDLSCIIGTGSGVPAPQAIPASVVSDSQQHFVKKLEPSVGDDVLSNGNCAAAEHSIPDSEHHSNLEMRLRSELKRSTTVACGNNAMAVENSIPAKKKKSKNKSTIDENKGALEANPSNFTVNEDSSHVKTRKSKRKLETTGNVDNKGQKQSKRKLSGRMTNDDVEKLPVEHVDIEEDVQDGPKKSRKNKKSKKDVAENAGDCSVTVKQGRKKNEVLSPLRDSVQEEEGEKKPKMKAKKKKEGSTNEETGDSLVEKRSSKRNSKPKSSPKGGGDNNQDTKVIGTPLEDETKTGKSKKKKKGNKSKKALDPPEDLVVSESQETVLSSHMLHENDDAETELGSINSQSSLINELLGIKKPIDHIARPELWYKNHILNSDSEDDVPSDEERMTGIPQKKKN